MLSQLEGFEAAVGSWEHDLLTSRLEYENQWLDQLFASGEFVWGRLEPPRLTDDSRGQVLTRVSPISLLRRADLGWLLPTEREVPVGFARWDAQAAYEALSNHGALFFDDLLAVTKLLPSQLEDALRELAALGLVTSDGFAAVRGLSSKSRHAIGRRAGRVKRGKTTYAQGGRWSRFPPFVQQVSAEQRAERWAWLFRYGHHLDAIPAEVGVAAAAAIWCDVPRSFGPRVGCAGVARFAARVSAARDARRDSRWTVCGWRRGGAICIAGGG